MAYREMLIALPAIVLFLSACVQTPDEVTDSGNESYMNSDYAAALGAYEGARDRVPTSGELHYNVGNAMYRMEEFEPESLKEYDDALLYANGELRARAFFNRGNSAFRVREYAQAVEAYKEVLRMKPDHLDAKHNLELALKQLPPQGRDDNQASPEAQPPQDQPPPQAQPPPQSEDDAQASPEAQPPQEPQTEPLTEEQGRRALEAVGEDAKTLAEGRQQVLVSPNPPPEFPW